MRYAIAAILLLFSVAAFGQLDQFRMVGSGSWSVVDDSTYSATVTFASDLTANSFLPTGVVDSMRVFTQRGQLYTIDSVGAKTFSTAVIYAVEYGGNWGSPSGQVLVYETRGRETVPAIPFATNGATSKLQEAVVTHNAAINNGVSTTQLADSTTAAKTYTNNQIAAVAPVKDTIVQASHGFSVGDPIWYSGDYLLSLDTGLTVRVDGVVSAVPDINTFVLQRTGRFTLTSHGFTVGVQLYIQPDGSYSATDTSNALVYGYPIDANTIEIGLKGDQIAKISDRYKGNVFGNFGLTSRDSSLDYLYEVSFLSKFQQEVNNISVNVDSISKYRKYTVIVKNDTISKLTRVGIPVPSASLSNRTFTVIDSSKFLARTYLESDGDVIIKYGDQFASKYYLDPGEIVTITYTDSTAIVGSNSKTKTIETLTDLSNGLFSEGEQVLFKGGYYKLQKSLPSYGIDNLFVVPVQEKAPYGENLIQNSENLSHGGAGVGAWNLSDAIRPNLPADDTPDQIIGISGEKTGWGITRDQTGGAIMSQRNSTDLSLGEKITVSFWIKLGESAVNDNVTLNYVTLTSVSTGFDLVDSNSPVVTPNADRSWTRFEHTFTTIRSQPDDWNLYFNFSIDLADTVYFDRIQVERTPSASRYKKTTTNAVSASDTSYAVYQPNENMILLSDLYREGINSDAEFLQKAINYAASFSPRKSVGVDIDLTIDDTYYNDSICIALPENMAILGVSKSNLQNPTITFDISDTTKYGIFYLNDLGGIYNEGQRIENLDFNTSSGLGTVIHRGSTSGYSIISEVYINGRDSTIIGIKTGVNGSAAGALFSYLNDVTVSSCHYNIVYENCGAEHYINGGTSGLSTISGLYINSNVAELSINGWDSEDHDASNIYAEGPMQELIIKDSYFENSNFYFNNIGKLRFVDGRMSGGAFSFGSEMNLVAFDGISFNDMVPRLPNKVAGSFINNNWASTNGLNDFNSYYQGNKYVYRFNNRSDLGGSGEWQQRRNELPYSDLIGGYVDGTFTGNLSDTIYTDNTIITGGGENLLVYSDSIGVEGSFGRFDILNNIYPDPITLDSTADLIVPTTNFTSPDTWAYNRTLPIAPEIGSPVIYSVWVKRLSTASVNTNLNISINVGGVDYSKTIYPRSTEWKRYYIIVDSIQNSSTIFKSGLGSGFTGDSIVIARQSLTRGETLRSYVKTDATAIYNQGAKLTIKDTDNNLEIVGGLDVSNGIKTDSLLDATGNFHYTTGADTPTTDLSGQFTITHGLGTTPTHLSISNKSGIEYNFEYSCGSTSCTVTVYNGTGTSTIVASTGISISWAALR